MKGTDPEALASPELEWKASGYFFMPLCWWSRTPCPENSTGECRSFCLSSYPCEVKYVIFSDISMKGKVTLMVPFLSRGKLHPEDILATHSTKEVLMEMNTCAEQMAYHSDPKAEVMDGWNKTHVHETALVSGGTRML